MARFWALSVVIFFSIIFDQLIKGYVQSQDHALAVGYQLGDFYFLKPERFYGLIQFQWNFLSAVYFKWIPLFILITIFILFIKSLNKNFWISFGLSIIIAGLGSNTIDRFVLGFILDYILFYSVSFNLSDIAILFGSCFSVIGLFLDKKNRVGT